MSPDALLTFVIPVRHQDNARNWPVLKANLAQTVRSVAAQTDGRWQAVVVANEGADLPDLPAQVSSHRVEFPPNPLHDLDSAERSVVYDAVRLDKGRRILAGLIATRPRGHVMVVDDDDLVSRRLTELVAANSGCAGWYVRDGLVWSGGPLAYRYTDFSTICGTSHIVNSTLLDIPVTVDALTESEIREVYGSHRFLQQRLRDNGTPLAPLPFLGAVYRVGHPGSHSQSASMLRKYFDRSLLLHPGELSRRLSRVTLLGAARRSEFFGIAG